MDKYDKLGLVNFGFSILYFFGLVQALFFTLPQNKLLLSDPTYNQTTHILILPHSNSTLYLFSVFAFIMCLIYLLVGINLFRVKNDENDKQFNSFLTFTIISILGILFLFYFMFSSLFHGWYNSCIEPGLGNCPQ